MLFGVKRLYPLPKRTIQLIPVGLVFTLVIYLSYFKLGLLKQLTATIIGENNEFDLGIYALKHDLIIYFWSVVLFLASVMTRSYLFSTLLRAASIVPIFVWAVDLFVINFFTTRLTIQDILKFADQWNANTTFLTQLFPGRTWLLIVIIFIVVMLLASYMLIDVKPFDRKVSYVSAVFPIILLGINLTNEDATYVHSWTYHNVFEVNAKLGISKNYSAEFAESLNKSPYTINQRTECISGRREQPNIVLVIFESLSMYHSEYFSKLPSMVPNFDQIARDNTAYTNFFSNGFNTEAGLVSIFTGKHLLPPIKEYEVTEKAGFSFRGFQSQKGSLVELFNRNGYFTAFLTSGNLTFLKKGHWLKSIGFKYIEGAESKFYNGLSRFHFDAAPDMALYKRVLQALTQLKGLGRPLMLTVETVSTHQPFVNPIDFSRDETSAFKYADRALGYFYDALKENKFFDNGILVIVGDHRAMTGTKKPEINLYGKSAASRVPLVIAYGERNPAREITTYSQQADFIPSFEYIVDQKSCTGPLNGNFLSDPPIEPEYILFPRGDNRDLVDIYSSNGTNGTIRINGDKTELIDGNTNDAERIIIHIGKERLRISRAENNQ